MTDPDRKDDVTERAALYALGALTPEEARAFEADVASVPACRQALADARAVIDDLAYAAPPHEPPAGLRDRVLSRIAAEGPAVFDSGLLHFVRSQRIDWQAAPLPGVQMKRLFLDEERGRRTTLVRLAPGAIYPAHRHRDVEEIYLLEGELTISGIAMKPGDYCRAEPDSVHEDTLSEQGCVFIVTASVHDQLVA